MSTPPDEPLTVDPIRLMEAADRHLQTGCRYPDPRISLENQKPDFTLLEWNEAHNMLVRLGKHQGPMVAIPKLKGGVE